MPIRADRVCQRRWRSDAGHCGGDGGDVSDEEEQRQKKKHELQMNVNGQQFEMWFKKPITQLQTDPSTKDHAGYAVLLISIPLLERYLREKSGIHEGSLDDAFYDALCVVFPEIPRDKAKAFYDVFRNGLAHQVTIKAVPGAAHGQIQNAGACIVHDATSNHFSVHPTEFAERVLKTIGSDFHTFEAKSSKNHPLGQVLMQGQTPITMSILLPANPGATPPAAQGSV